MPSFSYKAKTATGKTVSGQFDATDQASALDVILSSGQTPLQLEEAKQREDWRAWFQRQDPDFNPSDAGALAQDLSRLIGSGFSLFQALQMVAVSSESKRARLFAARAADHIGKGGSLSEILLEEQGGAAQALAGLVQAGEASGELQPLLRDAAESFSASAEFRDRLTSALIYPMIILFMISMTLIVFFSFVLPRLQPLFDGLGDRLPLATRALLAFGAFCEIWMPWILLLSLVLFIVLQLVPKLKQRLTRSVHGLMIGPLGLGAPRLAAYAAYARTCGLLINSGVPLPSANAVAAEGLANTFLKDLLGSHSSELREGQRLSDVLSRADTPPEILTRMTYLGERSGKLGPALIDAAGILERKARTRTDRLLSALTPAITIFLGLLVALVVGALFVGIASLTDVTI